ncbi:MAG TPA: serine/threonine-protein kinase, partial [Gemmataceae bacterium]|nr:serine/threonine-protein kinase [Gemmataceae bacterium]
MFSHPNDMDVTRASADSSVAEGDTQAPIPPPTPPVLPTVPGYEILDELGRGGMGVVYRARQLGFNRIVALKMVLSGAHAGSEERERFRIEAEAVARLQHPNIVQVYEVGGHDGTPFFSMEFCPGGGLDRKLNATPLPPTDAARLVETLARGVQAAHEKGVVHRDLKPANVLLAESGALKLTDFGLAKRMDIEGRTQSGVVVGTPSYMAPEQAGGRSREIGPAVDVYALGAILYECLVGRPPFKGPTALDTLTQVLSDDPVPPRQLQSKTPRDLETICLKCLEKQPGRRYATAADLAADLGRWQRGEPVHAQPPSLAYVLGKQVRRYRTPLAVAAGVVLLLAAVVTTAFVLLLGAWATARKNYETADQRRRDVEKKQAELQEALNAKQQTLDNLNQQLSTLAASYADRSDIEYRAGRPRECVNWMLRAYEVAPVHDPLRPAYLRLIASRGRRLSDMALWHDGPVHQAVFSPDGRTVLTASDDHTVHLWDSESGKELFRFAHEGVVWAASFSPDGRTLLTASQDHTARFWDAATGKELHRLQHDHQVWSASFSHDGRRILTASEDHTARLWDADSGKELLRLNHDGRVLVASFSPDDRTIVTASVDDCAAHLWDAASGRELHRLENDTGWMRLASFSPDGRKVVTANEGEHAAWVWDAVSGTELYRLPHDDGVTAASFSPDGRTILTASQDRT